MWGGWEGLGGQWLQNSIGLVGKTLPKNTDEIHKTQAYLKSLAGMQKVDKKN